MTRPFTFSERSTLYLLSGRISQIDEQLGTLFIALADGDESARAKIYDRLNVIGRFDLADKLAGIIERGG